MRTHPLFNGKKVVVMQIVFNRETKAIIAKNDVSSRFRDQSLNAAEIAYEATYKAEALNDLHGNCYYEISDFKTGVAL
jgi:hypothetical protein